MTKPIMSNYELLYLFVSDNDNQITNEQLLENWLNDVLLREDYSFDSGLLGLGWMICYLIHEEYLEGNADEILEDIDDTIYKLTIKEVISEEINIENLIQFMTYYQQRLTYKSEENYFRRFSHLECLKLLVEKGNQYLKENNDLQKSVDLLLKYSFLVKTCMYEELVEAYFYKSIEDALDQLELDGIDDIESVLKLGLAIKQYEHPYWEEKIQYIISKCYLHDRLIWNSIYINWDKENKVSIDHLITTTNDHKALFEILTNIEKVSNKEFKTV